MNLAKTSLQKEKIKFLLLEGVHQSAVDSLHHAGYTNVEYVTTALSDQELKERIKDAHFVGIRSRTQLTREVFEAATKLNAVGCFCIGTNQVDLHAAQEHGVAVFNAPFSNTRSVAELVIAQAVPSLERSKWLGVLLLQLREDLSELIGGQAHRAFEARLLPIEVIGIGKEVSLQQGVSPPRQPTGGG